MGYWVKSCNTATGGQEYLDVDGGPGLVFLLEGWFWSMAKTNGKKEAPSKELSPTVVCHADIAHGENVFWHDSCYLPLAFHSWAFLRGRQMLPLGLALVHSWSGAGAAEKEGTFM
jgi:hypothetical protein